MSIKVSHELKQLNSRLLKLESEKELLTNEIRDAQRRQSDVAKLINSITKQINDIKSNSSSPVVTEHALLRYLERVKGVNLQAVEREILTDSLLHYIDKLGNGKFPIGSGGRAVVQNRTIITIEI